MLAGGIIAFVPAFLVFYITAITAVLLGFPSPPGVNENVSAGVILNLLVLSPVIETCILSAFLIVLYRFLPRILPASILTGAVAAFLHYDSKGAYGLIPIAWEFCVFSALFLQWWKQSYWQAWLAAAIPHYLLNLWILCLNAWMLGMGS